MAQKNILLDIFQITLLEKKIEYGNHCSMAI